MMFDPLYLILVAPALLLALWAQARVKTAYAHASRVPVRSRMSGAEAARALLDSRGLRDVRIEISHGMLSDHYDPRHKVLRLSPEVYGGRSAASVGIAAHEAGHAIQDATGYAPLVIRNGLVPMAMFGGNFAFLLFFVGFIFQLGFLVNLAIALFGAVVVFQLVNLPVEFNASKRAKEQLATAGIVAAGEEQQEVSRVLNAAAWTYVAATLMAALQLIYFILRARE